MCGRAGWTDEELEFKALNDQLKRHPLRNFNVNAAPTEPIPFLRVVDSDIVASEEHWGLIPPFSNEFKMKFSTINAKSEEIFEKRLYKGPIKKKRGIVCFQFIYEWQKPSAGTKIPFKIYDPGKKWMELAAIYESWKSKEGDERLSISILTVAANEFMAKIHNDKKRMPLFMEEEDRSAWLDPNFANEKGLKELLNKYSKRKHNLEAYPISPMVNNPRNKDVSVLENISGEILRA